MKEIKSDSSCTVGVGREQSAQHNSLALMQHALLCQSCWVPCAAKPSGFMNLAQWMLSPLSATEKLEAQTSPEQSQPSSPPAEGQQCSPSGAVTSQQQQAQITQGQHTGGGRTPIAQEAAGEKSPPTTHETERLLQTSV